MEQWSYISSPTLTPYIYTTITRELQRYADILPGNEAFIFYNKNGVRTSITFADLWKKVNIFARKLLDMELDKGARVAVVLSNSIEAAVCILGTIAAGGVVAFVSSEKADGSDVKEMVERMSCHFILFENKNVAVCRAVGETCNTSDESITVMRLPSGRNDKMKIDFEEIFSNFSQFATSQPLPTILPEDPVVIFTTSGSTGRPKLVLQSHFSLKNCISMFALCGNVNSGQTYYCDRQFSWNVGFPAMLIITGVTRVFMDTRVCNTSGYGKTLCNVLTREKCDAAFLSPYVIHDLIQSDIFESTVEWKPIKRLILGGQRFESQFCNMIGVFCDVIISTYGSTEVGPSTSRLIAGKTYEGVDSGYPTPGSELKITDSDGNVLPVNHSGEINIRNNATLIEYYMDPETTKKAFGATSRWYKSGDVGHITEKGTLVMEGRLSELISRGTRKIIPENIEREVCKCPGVKTVMAVPVPDNRLGEEVCLCVMKKEESTLTQEQLEKFCESVFLKEEILDTFGLRPKYYLMLDQFPMLSNGKYSRRRLASHAIQTLGLGEVKE